MLYYIARFLFMSRHGAGKPDTEQTQLFYGCGGDGLKTQFYTGSRKTVNAYENRRRGRVKIPVDILGVYGYNYGCE